MLPFATTPPDPVRVDIISNGTPWWEVVSSFGPLAILLTAVITGVFAWRNIRDRREADQRSQWWSRAEWALDASMSEDPPRQEIGLGVLDSLAGSDLAGPEELAILEVAWARFLSSPEVMDGVDDMGENGPTEQQAVKEADDEHHSEPKR